MRRYVIMSKIYDQQYERFVVYDAFIQRSRRMKHAHNKIPDEYRRESSIRMFEMVNELVACSQTANENSYGWIRHQEKPGRMISMGSIGPFDLLELSETDENPILLTRLVFVRVRRARYRILPVTLGASSLHFPVRGTPPPPPIADPIVASSPSWIALSLPSFSLSFLSQMHGYIFFNARPSLPLISLTGKYSFRKCTQWN